MAPLKWSHAFSGVAPNSFSDEGVKLNNVSFVDGISKNSILVNQISFIFIYIVQFH